ncbi:MAG TPA: SMR family transporter [Leptolyngbyaceae cyanobacterium]
MSWLFLFLAIACEIFSTTSLKFANGFSKPIYLIGAFIGYPLAFSFFNLSLRNIEISIGYTVWSGVGIMGTSLLTQVASYSLARDDIGVQKQENPSRQRIRRDIC